MEASIIISTNAAFVRIKRSTQYKIKFAMVYEIVKISISAILIALISEISKRNSLFAAIFASIPLISLLAIIWLYIDTHNVIVVSKLASNIFWLVIPSLILFITLPILLRYHINFYLSLSLATAFMIIGYFAMMFLLRVSNIKF